MNRVQVVDICAVLICPTCVSLTWWTDCSVAAGLYLAHLSGCKNTKRRFSHHFAGRSGQFRWCAHRKESPPSWVSVSGAALIAVTKKVGEWVRKSANATEHTMNKRSACRNKSGSIWCDLPFGVKEDRRESEPVRLKSSFLKMAAHLRMKCKVMKAPLV